MQNDIFRILAPTAILGYGFPEDSLARALQERIDLIAVDAGSVDAGPYYLGSGEHYVGRAALERDLRLLIQAASAQQCPLVIGSAGFSGADKPCDEIAALVKTIVAGEIPRPLRLAVIHAGIDGERVAANIDALEPLGRMPGVSEETIRQSNVVGQMGVEPVMTVLAGGADIVVCGRAYDPAVFAALPMLRGFDPGLCYHAGKILECGAIACIPGSGGDCLVGEIHRDGHAEFYAPNPARSCTPASIAAHSLYEKSRPDFFHLPGGMLSIQETEFYAIDERRTAIRGSRFLARAPSIKLEGSRLTGRRTVSILPVDPAGALDERIPLYGRTGAGDKVARDELGIVCIVTGDDEPAVRDVLAALRAGTLHYGFPDRRATAGNLAFPCSPSDITAKHRGGYCRFFIAGSRDPAFAANWPDIRAGVIDQVAEQLPRAFDRCEVDFFTTDTGTGFAWIETRDDDALHAALLDSAEPIRRDAGFAFERVDAGAVYEWTLHHLIHDREFLNELFPIRRWRYDGTTWSQPESLSCDWTCGPAGDGPLPDHAYGAIPEAMASGTPARELTSAAAVIRSKNAGINELTWDIFFTTDDDFRTAVRSGTFTRANMSRVLNVAPEDIVETLAYPPARAVKITAHRKLPAGNFGDRDVFGAQQHGPLLGIRL